jgi:hypothetical protein
MILVRIEKLYHYYQINLIIYKIACYGLIMSFLPTTFTGGILAMFTSIYAYIILTTPTKFRSLRIAITEVLNGIGKFNLTC